MPLYDHLGKTSSKMCVFNYYSRNLVLFNFCGDNASFPTSFHVFQYDGWSNSMPSIVAIYSKHAGCVLHLLNRTDCYVWLYQKNVWLFMLEMHLISDIIDGWQECELPPSAKANVKNGPQTSLHFVICYSFGFKRLLFACVFRSVFRWFRVFV